MTTNDSLEAAVRRIVREEIQAHDSMGQRRPVAGVTGNPSARAAVDAFLATLEPGERVRGGLLYQRWRAWEGAEAYASVTQTAFGMMAARSRWILRTQVSGTRIYQRVRVEPT